MPFFRRERARHAASVHEFPDRSGSWYVVMCDCGWVGPRHETREEAFAEAYRHASNVSETVELEPDEEGAVGWLCVFCGASVEQAALQVRVSWTDDGVEREQWWAAHRACFVERIADDEAVRGGPLFEDG